MTATISFLAGEGFTINDLAGSGLGFYKDSFGGSIRVGEYNTKTYITNSAGTTQGPEVDNIKYANEGSGIVGSAGSAIPVTSIPNYQATLNTRATFDSAVQVVSATMYAYDRSSINNDPSGVTVKMAQVIHPDTTQTDNGSGQTTWTTPHGTGVTVSMCPSPGPSGLYAGNGSNSTWEDTQHDWFHLISVSPDSIGSKTQLGLYVELEYL